MITARTAHEQGRQVFAIPGIWAREHRGTNQLIRDRAIVVIETEDILREYEYLYGKSIDTAKLAAAEKSIATRARCSLRWEYRQDLPPGAQQVESALGSRRALPKENKKSGIPARKINRKDRETSPKNLPPGIISTAQKEEEPPSRKEDDRAIVASLTTNTAGFMVDTRHRAVP